jgi:hypothetical protein
VIRKFQILKSGHYNNTDSQSEASNYLTIKKSPLENRNLPLLKPKIIFALALIATSILSIRCPDWAWRSVWAEDGTVFYQQSIFYSATEYFTTPYAGYFFTLHRILIYPAHYLPLITFGFYCFAVAAVNYFLVFYLVIKSLNGRINSSNLTIFILGMALIPAAAGEALQNINNLQWFWYVAWAFVTIFPFSQSNKFKLTFWTLSILLVASAPAILPMILILAIFRIGFFSKGSKFTTTDFLGASVVVVLGIFQLLSAFQNRVSTQNGFNTYLVTSDSFFRLLGTSLFGKLTFQAKNQNLSFVSIFIIACIAVFMILSLKIYFYTSTHAIAVLITLLIPSVMGITASLETFETLAFSNPLAGGRFFVTSGIGMLFFLIYIRSIYPNTIGNYFVSILGVLIALGMGFNFATNESRRNGDFTLQVEKMQKYCTNQTGQIYSLPISPQNWNIQLRCK